MFVRVKVHLIITIIQGSGFHTITSTYETGTF